MKTKNIYRATFIAVGLAIVVYLSRKIGFESIMENFRVLGWMALPILAIGIVWYFLYTLAWHQFLKRLKGKIGIFELFRTKIAGEAVNTVTPASFLGGDSVRVYILKKHFPLTESAASVVVDRTLYTMALLIVIYLGIIAAFWRLPFLPLNMRYGLPIILIISSLFMGFVYSHQRRGLFTFLIYLLEKLRIKKSFSKETVEKFQQLDGYIADFYLKNPSGFWSALILHFLGRLLGIVEIYAIGKIFYPAFSAEAALILGALTPLVNFIFAFIPGALGIMEGAYTGVLYLLKMPPETGLSIQVFRRARSILWIIVGFAALGTHNRKKILQTEIVDGI